MLSIDARIGVLFLLNQIKHNNWVFQSAGIFEVLPFFLVEMSTEGVRYPISQNK